MAYVEHQHLQRQRWSWDIDENFRIFVRGDPQRIRPQAHPEPIELPGRLHYDIWHHRNPKTPPYRALGSHNTRGRAGISLCVHFVCLTVIRAYRVPGTPLGGVFGGSNSFITYLGHPNRPGASKEAIFRLSCDCAEVDVPDTYFWVPSSTLK